MNRRNHATKPDYATEPRGNVPGQAGFTIIELMIATVVFSIILIVITGAIIQFSKQYYKGIIASSTQSAARTLIDDVGRSLEFNGGSFTATSDGTGYCVGNAKRYSYALNQSVLDNGPFGAHQGNHGLVSDTIVGCDTSTPSLPVKTMTAFPLSAKNPRELLGQHMRLTKFDISSSSGIFTITVRIIYGDDDLLCSPSVDGDCGNPNSLSGVNQNKPDLVCRSAIGSQYCAVSELTTIVNKRTTN